MISYIIKISIEAISNFLYYIVQGSVLLSLNIIGIFGIFSPKLRRKVKHANYEIINWFNEHLG